MVYFIKYFDIFYNEILTAVYVLLLSVFLLALVICLTIKRIKNRRVLFARIALVEYLVLIYCSTVFFRYYSERRGNYFVPFWSYSEILKGGNLDLLVDNIMNMIILLPFGFLLGMSFDKLKLWAAALIGLIISISIEAIQFFYKVGCSETDDVIHNTIGCIIGFGISILIRRRQSVKCK